MEQIPPFQVGDRVIRIGESHPEYNIIKGEIYTIAAIGWCCSKVGWRIDLEEVISPKAFCAHCFKRGNPRWQANQFRKIDDIPSGAEMLVKELEAPIGEPVYM